VAPLDYKLREQGLFNIGAHLPAVLGGDLVGTVVRAGPTVSSAFPEGSLIFAQFDLHRPAGGGLQEYTVISGLYTALVPLEIPAAEAALYPINIVTSALAIFTPDGFDFPFPGTPGAKGFDYAAQKIVIIGGGSNTGNLAVQLARLAGIGTIVAVASPGNTALLKDYGATHVISRHESEAEIKKQVRAITGDDLVHVLDTINRPDRTLALSLLSDEQPGILAHLTRGQSSDTLHAQKQVDVREQQVVGFPDKYPEFGKLFWKTFPGWLASGLLKPLKYKVIEGLDEAKVNAALDEYGGSRVAERWHVRISEEQGWS
jgi:NADPH2:quinone reductase